MFTKHILYIYVSRGFGIKTTYNILYAIKTNKTKSYIFNIYLYRGFGIK